MHVEQRDIDALLELQQIDLEILQTNKKRADLPQRAKVALLLKKKDELSAKAEQVAALREKSAAEMSKVETEDSQLAEKQRKAQELIDNAGTDYRSVESHSKELSGFAKRRETLSQRIDALSGELAKIDGIASQIEAAIAAVEREETSARASFAEQDAAFADQLEQLDARRGELAASIDAAVVDLYQKTAIHTGGVAVGRLIDDKCGVCRSVIEGGHLIQLKADAPLGVCPSCKRLLVVE